MRNSTAQFYFVSHAKKRRKNVLFVFEKCTFRFGDYNYRCPVKPDTHPKDAQDSSKIGILSLFFE